MGMNFFEWNGNMIHNLSDISQTMEAIEMVFEHKLLWTSICIIVHWAIEGFDLSKTVLYFIIWTQKLNIFHSFGQKLNVLAFKKNPHCSFYRTIKCKIQKNHKHIDIKGTWNKFPMDVWDKNKIAVAKINKSQSFIATSSFVPLNKKYKMAECMKIMFWALHWQ